MSAPVTVRPATTDDVPELVAMIRELARVRAGAARGRGHRGAPAADAVRRRRPRSSPTSPRPATRSSGWRSGSSTTRPGWARHNLYLEDLYVRPGHRGSGAGRLLLQTLAGVCRERGYQRLEWWVLDWNPARGFYETLGAEALTEWIPYRVSGDALARLAEPR